MLAQTESNLWLPSLDELALLSPGLILTATMVVVMMAAMIFGRRVGVCAVTAIAGLVAMFFGNVDVAVRLGTGPGQALLEPTAGAPMLIADNFTVFFNFLLICFMLAVIGMWMLGAARDTRDAPEFIILMMGSALGMSVMVSSLNLLVIIMAIELASMPSYAMVAFDKRSRKGAEGGLKYVVFGSISAAIMLYGASLLYGLFGTLDISVMAPMVISGLTAGGADTAILAIALVMFFAGIAFKISAVPFHFWCPDAFEGAQIEVTTWLSVVSKAAGLCLLVRIMHTLGSVSGAHVPLETMTIAIAGFAAVTCFVGNLAAYRQQSVKRMLAYSSIAHAGYMLMFAAIILDSDEMATSTWSGLIIYLAMYMFMNLGAFGATALVTWANGDDSIEHFNGLGRRNPVLAASLTICLFSLIGMPPLGGFIAKWWLLLALSNGDSPILWSLIVWASLNTLFSLFYYMRIIKHMYMSDDGRPKLAAHPAGVGLVLTCAIVLLLAGTFAVTPVRDRAQRYANNLFSAGAAVTLNNADAGDRP
jgi:NADH-quinone oxidoreductase subunit N